MPDLAAEKRRLQELRDRLDAVLPARVTDLRRRLTTLQATLEANSPLARLRHSRERLVALETGLRSSMQHGLAIRRERVAGLQRQLALMNPYATLDRGYSITYDAAGHVVSSVAGITPGDALAIQLSDGVVGAQASNGRTLARPRTATAGDGRG